ncbi:MAG: phosphotyrosine protein phosphatase [Planctomycetota bacterium]|nr:phosphotyrosine protein phosphatase [Planctomycetota bacterium]
MNVLFICSKNQWRSPTAEKVFQNEPMLAVRSRGVSRRARRTVSASDIRWADLILVMEPKHKQRLLADYPGEMKFQELHVLDIPDDYQFMDPELVELLKATVQPLIQPGREI